MKRLLTTLVGIIIFFIPGLFVPATIQEHTETLISLIDEACCVQIHPYKAYDSLIEKIHLLAETEDTYEYKTNFLFLKSLLQLSNESEIIVFEPIFFNEKLALTQGKIEKIHSWSAFFFHFSQFFAQHLFKVGLSFIIFNELDLYISDTIARQGLQNPTFGWKVLARILGALPVWYLLKMIIDARSLQTPLQEGSATRHRDTRLHYYLKHPILRKLRIIYEKNVAEAHSNSAHS